MKHAQILFYLGVLTFTATGALAKPAYVTSSVNLRAAPGTKSEIVGKIPGGSLIDAKECSENWCEVTWQDKRGFAIQSALDMSGRLPRQAARSPAHRLDAGYSPDAGYGPNAAYVAEDEPVYDAPPPRLYYYSYYGRPYYRPYWGWRRHWW